MPAKAGIQKINSMQNLQKILIILILITAGIAGFSFSLYQNNNSQKDIIKIYHYPTTFVAQLKGDPEAGKKVFKEFCASCHSESPVIDVHAPRIGDASAWYYRRQLGIDVLLRVTTQGVGAMPARGGCFECQDDELRQAINYILEKTPNNIQQRIHPHAHDKNP